MQNYHVNSFWFLFFHSLDYVRDFCSQNLHMYMTLLQRDHIYFSSFTIFIHSVTNLPILFHILCNICTIKHVIYNSSIFIIYNQVENKDIFVKQVFIKDNTSTIMPTISPFGLDGNHFCVSKPPANTKSYIPL